MNRFCALITWIAFGATVAFADTGRLTLTPAVTLERGLSVGINQPFEIRIVSDAIRDQSIATVNLTRGGRPMGELALKREGSAWVVRTKLELPGAHVLTVRVFDQSRIWVAATDLTVLGADDPQVPRSGEASETLAFTITTGKAGADVSGWWSILELLGLLGVVAWATAAFRRTPKASSKSI
jgi:hypothetical protein